MTNFSSSHLCNKVHVSDHHTIPTVTILVGYACMVLLKHLIHVTNERFKLCTWKTLGTCCCHTNKIVLNYQNITVICF